MGRYADLMDLDAQQFGEVVRDTWRSAEAGGTEAPPSPKGRRRKGGQRGRSAAVPEAPAGGGHLSRYPGDGSHLRAFTTTAEVPGVQRTVVSAGTPQGAPVDFSVTGVFPAAGVWVVPDRRIPLVLSGAIWVTVVLLAVAVGGLAVQHWEPKWLTAIHVVRSATTTTRPAAGVGRIRLAPVDPGAGFGHPDLDRQRQRGHLGAAPRTSPSWWGRARPAGCRPPPPRASPPCSARH